jgi:acyl dehydratase
MAEASLITPEIQAMVGRETTLSAHQEIGRTTISRFAVAVGDLNPLYFDEECAKKSSYGGIIAPPTMIFELVHNVRMELGEDGGYVDKILLPPPLTRWKRASNEYEFFQPVRPEDKITTTSKILPIFQKEGKSGPIVFVTNEITYKNQKGELLGINRDSYMFMPAQQG